MDYRSLDTINFIERQLGAEMATEYMRLAAKMPSVSKIKTLRHVKMGRRMQEIFEQALVK